MRKKKNKTKNQKKIKNKPFAKNEFKFGNKN